MEFVCIRETNLSLASCQLDRIVKEACATPHLEYLRQQLAIRIGQKCDHFSYLSTAAPRGMGENFFIFA